MSARPVLVSFCATFLKPEMHHVHRQVSGIRRFDHWILTRRRLHPATFPFPQIVELKKSPGRFLHRLWHQHLLRQRVPLSAHEIRQLESFAREKNAALVHVYFGTEAARLLPYLRREPRPKVVSFHGADVSQSLSDDECRGLVGHVDLFLCRSDSLRAALIERGFPAARIRLNRTGIPLPPEPPTRGPPDPGSPLRLLQACRMIPKKGLDVSLHAAALLAQEGVDVQLTLAGDGPELPRLQTLTRQLGLESRVSFPGFLGQRDLQTAFRSHHLFLHPSRTTPAGDREGIPNSLLEAMAHGLPVIATRHSGIPEAVEHGVDGWLIDPADPAALAAAIRALASDAPRYATLSRAARERIVREFSIDRCIAALEDAYLDLLAAHPVPTMPGS